MTGVLGECGTVDDNSRIIKHFDHLVMQSIYMTHLLVLSFNTFNSMPLSQENQYYSKTFS